MDQTLYSGKHMQSLSRRVAFAFDEQYASFELSLKRLLTDLLERERIKYMPPENVLGYIHGIRWLRSSSIDDREESEFSPHEHQITLKFEDIVNHRCNKLSEQISHLAEAMHGSIMRALYKELHDACASTGNVIDARSGSLALRFLEMLARIELGVDREGRLTLPQIHAGPEIVDKLASAISAEGPGFQDQVNRILERKKDEALRREAKRLERFVRDEQ